MNNSSVISISDYYEFKFLKECAVSLDGLKIAYVISSFQDKKEITENEFAKEEITQIWYYNLKSKEHKQLTYGTKDANPSWSPDGKLLAFISKRDEEPQVYILPITGGEADQATNFKQGVNSKIEWSPNTNSIIFCVTKSAEKPDLSKPYRFTRDFYRFDGFGRVNDFIKDIYNLNLSTDEVTQLTNDLFHNVDPKYSPDGSKVLYLCSFAPDEIAAYRSTIKILSDGKTIEPVKNMSIEIAEWINNDKICFVGVSTDMKIGSKQDLFVYDLK
ncbi:MAG: TolB family protein, partial [Candidatus Kariarchaeaceae archaeon]